MKKKMICFVLLFLFIFQAISLYCQDDDEIAKLIAKYTEDLESPYVSVRLNAVKELSKLLDRRTVTPLIYALNDESQFVRKEACTGLGELKHPRAVEPLGELLLKEKKVYVRKECAWALGNMGFQDALPYLKKQLKVEESLLVKNEIKKAIEKLEG